MATVQARGADVSEVQRLRAELAVVRQVPRDQARALPSAFYTSREYLEFEREALFRTQWICLGHIGAIPNVGEHFSKAACRLPQFASEIWQGYIFVNLDGAAPALGAALSPTEPYIRNYHPSEQQFLYEAQEVWQTNWKCLVENFMEGYHLSPLHAKTLHPVTPTALCEKLPDGDAFTGYRANFHPQCPERGPYHPDLTLQERRS